jgi:uncharacterized membrane protein YdfJ with MMPL/SSD domain
VAKSPLQTKDDARYFPISAPVRPGSNVLARILPAGLTFPES